MKGLKVPNEKVIFKFPTKYSIKYSIKNNKHLNEHHIFLKLKVTKSF
jgi:hypothetical protein